MYSNVPEMAELICVGVLSLKVHKKGRHVCVLVLLGKTRSNINVYIKINVSIMSDNLWSFRAFHQLLNITAARHSQNTNMLQIHLNEFLIGHLVVVIF